MKIDFSTIPATQISAMYLFVEMLGFSNYSRNPFSSDLMLRSVLRNFGDDFTQLYISRENLGVKSIGFTTSTWEAFRRFSAPLRPLLNMKSQIRFSSGTFLKKKDSVKFVYLNLSLKILIL
jgi:hypothetical protein